MSVPKGHDTREVSMAMFDSRVERDELAALRALADGLAMAAQKRQAVSHAVELCTAAETSGILSAWHRLAQQSLEPNPFLSPALAMAALAELYDVRDFRLAAVWRTEREAARLVALMPVSMTRSRWFLPPRLALAMAHNYGPLGTPLLDRDHGEEALDALLAWLRWGPLGARMLLVPFLPSNGPTAALFARVAQRLGLHLDRLHPFERALAAPAAPGPYSQAMLGKKKRHDLARQRRRLQDLGRLEHAVLATAAEIEDGMEAFLSLEAAGWKGRLGTATLQRADRAAFLRRGIREMAEWGEACIHRLTLDGRPIAAGIALFSGARAWFWKIAYDEAHARLSPGVQLALSLTDDCLARPGIRSIDSVADPGHPMMDHLFRERLAMADLLVDLTPGGSFWRRPAIGAERLRRHARATARGVLRRRPK
jgi:CelD/BcsL family acetyltransferase involved in cellulose biosynthesis